MIEKIEREIIWNGRKSGGTWFHPRATALPDGSVLMTCQHITGSDNFGQVHWSRTADGGTIWSAPRPIEAFARGPIGEGIEEGVCDVVPEYHAPAGVVLAMGHTVFYKNDALYGGDPPAGHRRRHSVYAVRDGKGQWSRRRELEWDDPRAQAFSMCGCAQRVTLENGDVLVPLYFAPLGRVDRMVTTVRYGFDGAELTFRQAGRVLELPVGRGLLEPSVTRFDGSFYLTIRAEDGHGYVSRSEDGLNWEEIRPWSFDDGEPLVMSTTQQRWLTHRGELYLVYTRKMADNHGVARWRAPLLIAQVDPAKRQLIRRSERVVFPMDGDGMAPGDHVARMGNFHTTAVSATESWVTVGEGRPNDGWNGDTLLGRVI
jgi:hypothetical protein